jgi:hypothetical protein
MQASSPEFLTPPRLMPHDLHSREQSKNSLAAELLQATGKLRLIARGNSMLPTLWPGDLLVIEKLGLAHAQVGDVILFARQDRFYIHRILRRDYTPVGPCLVTRGDAMPEADEPVLPFELLGKVIEIESGDKRTPVPPCSWMRRGIGLMLAHSARMRGLALRCHAWRSRQRTPNTDMAAREVRLG